MKLFLSLVLIVLSLLNASPVKTNFRPAQDSEDDDGGVALWGDFGRLFNSISESTPRWKADPQFGHLVKKVNSEVSFLEKEWKADKANPAPARYFVSLEVDADLIKAGPQQPNALKILTGVEKDLGIKVWQCVHGKKGWADLVKVTARTWKNGHESNGYEVWYAPDLTADSPSGWLRFPRFSTPTSEKLAPGFYRIGLKRSGEATPGAIPLTVRGDQTLTSMIIDLP